LLSKCIKKLIRILKYEAWEYRRKIGENETRKRIEIRPSAKTRDSARWSLVDQDMSMMWQGDMAKLGPKVLGDTCLSQRQLAAPKVFLGVSKPRMWNNCSIVAFYSVACEFYIGSIPLCMCVFLISLPIILSYRIGSIV
jgi:hypothetical protein